jgi:RNA polymerase sigma factor (sigma-70 family)
LRERGDDLSPLVQHYLRRFSRDLGREVQEVAPEALEEMPVAYREVIVLRELEGFSYKEIAAIVHVPPGTVMSRLARARGRLQKCLGPRLNKAG